MADKMPSARFRRRLREQLPLLEADGLLSPRQTQALTDRYRLNALNAEATSILLMTIYTIGAVLIGIGIISFVAAHWNDIGRAAKLVMLISAMLAAHLGGMYLWQIRGSYPKLGHTLVLLGTLIFGANIGLIAQIFHIHSNPYNGFLVWSIGALVLAYAVKNIPNATVAIVAFSIYSVGSRVDWSPSPQNYLPLIAIALFVPFIYYNRSGWMLALTLVLLAILIPLSCAQHDYYEYYFSYAWAFSVGMGLAGLLFFGWGMANWQTKAGEFISVPAWLFGVVCPSIMTYLCSFFDFCRNVIYDKTRFPFTQLSGTTITAGLLLLLAVGLFILSIRKWTEWILAALHILIAAMFAMFVVLPLVPQSSYMMAFLANVLFILMIILLFWAAFSAQDRRIFWAAVLMAALLILSRTVEYDTGLLIKAVIFTACGVGIIVAGVMFERFLKARRAA